MRGRWKWLAAVVGMLALLRQRSEAQRVRRQQLEPLGPDGTTGDPAPRGLVHRRAAGWLPTRPATGLGRAASSAWAAPLSALGTLGGLLGGRRPRWHHDHGIALVADVRGPFRWFLRAQSASAATLGQVVLLRDRHADDRLLEHEATHARQQERLGPLFALAYPLATAIWGYRANPFEVAARAASRDRAAGRVPDPLQARDA